MNEALNCRLNRVFITSKEVDLGVEVEGRTDWVVGSCLTGLELKMQVGAGD